MKIIDGKKIAEGLLAELKKRPAPKKFLAAVLVGSDPASASFVAQKEKIARILGIDFRVTECLPDVSERELVDAIRAFVDDRACGGIVLQLPLPTHLDRAQVIAAIPLEKDVDALRGGDLVLPPAVGAVQEILKIENLTVAVVGMGFLVGQPIAKWLKGKSKELIALDIGDDLARLKDADVVILGTGKAGLVKPEMLKNDVLVVDFGYSRDESGNLRGDFDSSHQSLVMSQELAFTPTPGGTGPILVAKLFENFYTLNAK